MVTRINGFSNSGIDVDSLVQKLMKAQQAPLDKLKQKKQVLEWQQDDFRTLNSKILDFKNLSFNMKLQSSYLTKKTSSSNDTLLSAAATPSAINGTYTLQVNRLASAAQLTSDNKIGATSKGGANATLADMGMSPPGPAELTITGSKGSTTIQVNMTDTLSGLASAINLKANLTGVTANYDATLDRFFFASSTTGEKAVVDIKTKDIAFLQNVLGLSPGLDPTADKITGGLVTGKAFTSGTPPTADGLTKINGSLSAPQVLRIEYKGEQYNFTIKDTTNISTLINGINSTGLNKAGVTAYLDVNGKLNFFNPDKDEKLTFSDMTVDSEDILGSLGLTSTPTGGDDYDYYKSAAQGQDALVEYNGLQEEKFSSNTFTINGVTYTAKSEMTAPVSISVSQDVDAVYNNIKNFIDKYNDLISSIDSKINETRNRSYLPLTDDERSAMTDDQIKLWETQAKSGLLHNDTVLNSALSNFRLSMTSAINNLPAGDLKVLSEIGITTTSYLDRGKLTINESKLKEALTNYPDKVMNMFTASDNDTSDNGHGFAVRLYDQTSRIFSLITDKAGTQESTLSNYDIGKQITDINKQITTQNSRLQDLEDRYYKQFSAMESAISKLQSQGSSLLSKIGGTS
ncbi:flagellar filament capping protein FliD [Paenibacillus thalictri]|uniref:Flagellar hook-associated protein 2 n=1 Tax=Paenibacillus thalictri TaxID=2527873 RepID=A0A4Q9DMJ8_9BACL|nr:flagellar filament capping protein FliD [Paenibacillus thalictri]TBL73016.1 hypothetical protein EYB31_27705 [Paenibacillus thalictri]